LRRAIFVTGILLVFVIVASVLAASPALYVHFIDVGQADAILIQAPSGQNILIDAGNNADSDLVLGYLRQNGTSD
jgi:beta-lactamase superfamily II metal-dependent hydrolase